MMLKQKANPAYDPRHDDPEWLRAEAAKLCDAVVAFVQNYPTAIQVRPFAMLSATAYVSELACIHYPMLAVLLAKGCVQIGQHLAPNHVEIEDVPVAPITAMKETRQ